MKIIPLGKLQFHTFRVSKSNKEQRIWKVVISNHLFLTQLPALRESAHAQTAGLNRSQKRERSSLSLLGTAGQRRRAGIATLSRVTALRLVIILNRRLSGNLKRPARQRRFLHNKGEKISFFRDSYKTSAAMTLESEKSRTSPSAAS